MLSGIDDQINWFEVIQIVSLLRKVKVKFEVGRAPQMTSNPTNMLKYQGNYTYGVELNTMSAENPIVAFEHVPKNDWGAGLNPIWQDGTVGGVVWTRMAHIYGVSKAHIPPDSVIARAIIHYNDKTI
jgi:hypothetical protein